MRNVTEEANLRALDVVLDRLAEGSISGMQYEQWCLRLQRTKEVGGLYQLGRNYRVSHLLFDWVGLS